MEGTIYMVSPDGSSALSPELRRTALTQGGYGVRVPACRIPLYSGAPRQDGVWITETETGRRKLLVSLEEIIGCIEDQIDPCRKEEGDFSCFHLKWNPQGTRIMAVIRWKPWGGVKSRIFLVTLQPDGTDIRLILPPSTWGPLRGHHPNWCPDGKSIIMNLAVKGNEAGLRFVRIADYSGEISCLDEDIPGSGHPTLYPGDRGILADRYQYESEYDDGTTVLRWIDLKERTDTEALRIHALPSYEGPLKERRVDLHPAWDRGYRYVVFNGMDRGRRGVFIADFQTLCGKVL